MIWSCPRSMTGARSFLPGSCCRLTALFCRNEDVIDAHIHACSGIPIQTISTLSTFTSQPFPIIVIGNQIAEAARQAERRLYAVDARRFSSYGLVGRAAGSIASNAA